MDGCDCVFEFRHKPYANDISLYDDGEQIGVRSNCYSCQNYYLAQHKCGFVRITMRVRLEFRKLPPQ